MKDNYLETLFLRREHPVPSVFSVYLDVDESNEINLNRGFERRLKEIIASVQKTITNIAEAERFTVAALRISDFISTYEVHAHSIAMFFDTTDGFFWHEEVNVPMVSQARWGCELFLQPLVAAVDEFERYLVVLLDHANMRVLRMSLGQIEEVAHKNFSCKAVQHIRGVGTDHLGSASHVQHKADENVRANLRRMITDIEELVRADRVEHIVLGGARETTSALLDLLPKRLATLVVGSLTLALDATPADVFNAVSEVASRVEREGEAVIVRDVLTAAAKNEKAVSGVGRTLNAVNQGRVWQLVYSEGFHLPGFECATCLSLVTVERDGCAYCGGALRRVPDVVEHAVAHAIRRSAKVELVKDDAALALNKRGGIAAFLRARPSSMHA